MVISHSPINKGRAVSKLGGNICDPLNHKSTFNGSELKKKHRGLCKNYVIQSIITSSFIWYLNWKQMKEELGSMTIIFILVKMLKNLGIFLFLCNGITNDKKTTRIRGWKTFSGKVRIVFSALQAPHSLSLLFCLLYPLSSPPSPPLLSTLPLWKEIVYTNFHLWQGMRGLGDHYRSGCV